MGAHLQLRPVESAYHQREEGEMPSRVSHAKAPQRQLAGELQTSIFMRRQSQQILTVPESGIVRCFDIRQIFCRSGLMDLEMMEIEVKARGKIWIGNDAMSL